jgi:uncharacterized protein (TIGR02246 family)
MKATRTLRVALATTLLGAAGCSPPAPPAAVTTAEVAALRSELAAAEAQNEIRALMHAYGRLIDARDWEGFAKLWADDAVYVGGPGSETLKGGPAIADFLRRIIGANPSGVGEPNFHVFFNEEIEVGGDRARATSMSTFVTPGPAGTPVMAILARYEDEYVRVGNDWRFSSRVVRGNLPAPRRPAK